ncbi:hypothetical protein D3C74_253720 [compost metagenome]
MIQFLVIFKLVTNETILKRELQGNIRQHMLSDISRVDFLQRNESINDRNSVDILKLQSFCHFPKRYVLMLDRFRQRNLHLVQ